MILANHRKRVERRGRALRELLTDHQLGQIVLHLALTEAVDLGPELNDLVEAAANTIEED